MKKKSVERKLKRHFQEQTEYLPTLAVEGVTSNQRAYSARRLQKPLLIALTAYLAISIAVVAWVAVRYMDQAEPVATTTDAPKETEPAFEIRRPSAEQDALFKMERITDTHPTTEFYYDGYRTFEDLILRLDNPLRKPIIIRVSLVDGVSIIPDRHQHPQYYTEVQYRIEEIYYSPKEIDLEVGDTDIIKDHWGIVDGKMWYYKGELPLMDCYEYYLIGFQDDSEKGFSFTYTVPAADCFEQYEETMNYYGFDVMDVSSIFHNAYPRLKNFIAGSKYWFENEDKVQLIKNRLAEADNDRLWHTLVDANREILVTPILADQINLGDTIEEVISTLGNPQSIRVYGYYNKLTYNLTPDGSETIDVYYDYGIENVTSVNRTYTQTILNDRAVAETIQVGMTYDEVVDIMGTPRFVLRYMYEVVIPSYMKYTLSDGSQVTFDLDFTQTEPVVTSIRFN